MSAHVSKRRGSGKSEGPGGLRVLLDVDRSRVPWSKFQADVGHGNGVPEVSTKGRQWHQDGEKGQI